MDHQFAGPDYTVGIEEELMILDAETLDLSNAVETFLDAAPPGPGTVAPELMESVLEVATEPCSSVAAAGEQLRRLRVEMMRTAAANGLAIGSAGTHPFAMWEDQRIVQRDRYRDLVNALSFVARQELIFGTHVHVGIEGADKAIHVANGMRVHVPLLLALSANSPFWRASPTGMLSTRTPIFRAFPRVGIPPSYVDWADYSRRIEFMTRSKVMEDYTWLWYDVRPHPNFGTVEVRVMDGQTRVEHTLAIAALVQALVKELSEHFDEGRELAEYPYEMLDENKWLAARSGLDAALVDLPTEERVRASDLAERVLERMRPHADELGSSDELAVVEDMLEKGNGATRQLLVYEANHDLREVMGEIVEKTAPAGVEEPSS